MLRRPSLSPSLPLFLSRFFPSHPFRICSLFVRLPARFYLRSIFPSFISFPPQPARALFRFFLRFFALSTFIYSSNFFYSCTYAPRTEDTTWGRWAEEWAEGESGREQKLERRSCKTQRVVAGEERERERERRLYSCQAQLAPVTCFSSCSRFTCSRRSNVRSRCRWSVKPAPGRVPARSQTPTYQGSFTRVSAARAPPPFHMHTRVHTQYRTLNLLRPGYTRSIISAAARPT